MESEKLGPGKSCSIVVHSTSVRRNPAHRLWHRYVSLKTAWTPRKHVFSRMRSKGSRFTLGVGGLRVCSLDVAFVVATVRVWGPYGRAYGKFCRGVVFFGCFKRLVASFRVAGVALRDIQTCSVTCRKSFCVAGAILLRRFQKMCCIFRGSRSTFDVSIVIFRGRRSTLDVSCCVFIAYCKSHWQGCVKWRQGANSVASVAFGAMCWKSTIPRTKHWFWGCKFSGSKENS